jgi:hypothetical protein
VYYKQGPGTNARYRANRASWPGIDASPDEARTNGPKPLGVGWLCEWVPIGTDLLNGKRFWVRFDSAAFWG